MVTDGDRWGQVLNSQFLHAVAPAAPAQQKGRVGSDRE